MNLCTIRFWMFFCPLPVNPTILGGGPHCRDVVPETPQGYLAHEKRGCRVYRRRGGLGALLPLQLWRASRQHPQRGQPLAQVRTLLEVPLRTLQDGNSSNQLDANLRIHALSVSLFLSFSLSHTQRYYGLTDFKSATSNVVDQGRQHPQHG